MLNCFNPVIDSMIYNVGVANMYKWQVMSLLFSSSIRPTKISMTYEVGISITGEVSTYSLPTPIGRTGWNELGKCLLLLGLLSLG